MALSLKPEADSLDPSAPRELFALPPQSTFEVAPDGQRLLVTVRDTTAPALKRDRQRLLPPEVEHHALNGSTSRTHDATALLQGMGGGHGGARAVTATRPPRASSLARATCAMSARGIRRSRPVRAIPDSHVNWRAIVKQIR